MERQLTLPLGSPEEREAAARRYLARLHLPGREVDLLGLLAARGEVVEVKGQELWRLTISVTKAAQLAGCAKGTFLAAADALVERELLTVLPGRPRTYVANWSRIVELLDRLPPAEPAGVDEFAAQVADLVQPQWGETVSHGQPRSGARDSVSRVDRLRDRETVSRGRDSMGALTKPDQTDRPWQTTTDADLRRAVIDGELEILRRLYREARALGWIDGSADARLRFLTVAHHCATSVGLHRRMAAFVARMKRAVDVNRTRAQSEAWARAQLDRAQPRAELPRELVEPIGTTDP